MSLRAQALSLRVPRATLVEALDFELAPGDFCALLGRNGAGKSTLLHCLAALRAPQGGQVSLNGQAVEKIERHLLAQRVGVLLQDESESFWGSTLEYVALGRLPYLSALAGLDTAALEAAQQEIDKMELNAQRDQPYRSLSGGERQRARIAQLLVQDPDFFLLDEPLAHLDLGHQKLAMERFAALARAGRGVLASLHEPLWAARYGKQALLLYDAGHFVCGPAPEVLSRENLEALYACRLEFVTAGDRTLLIPSAS